MAGAERERTYGVVGFVLLFVAMAGLGLVLVLTVDSPSGPTGIVATPQTTPGGVEVSMPASDVDGSEQARTSPAAPASDPPRGAVFPDGSIAPDGVNEVLVEDGVIVVSFEVPESIGTADWTPEVPPVTTEVAGEDRLVISVGCGRSRDEVLVQVAITESPEALTVLAVAAAPEGGGPCDPTSPPRVIEVPLVSPVGSRAVIVVPSGSDLLSMGGR